MSVIILHTATFCWRSHPKPILPAPSASLPCGVYPVQQVWVVTGSSIALQIHREVADRTGFRRVLPLVRGLCGDRDHVALGQMMTRAVLDACSARLAGRGCLRVDHLAAGDELRFAIHYDEHVVGVVVHLGAAPHDALGDDD